MRYTITSQQFDFFHREGHIQFEGLYSEDEVGILKLLLKENDDGTGRDLHAKNITLQKAMFLSRLGQVVTALTKEKPLFLAFSQFIPPYKKAATLEEISSLTEVCCLAIINLCEDPLPHMEYLPDDIGGVGFYQTTFPIDYPKLKLPLLLIAFTTEKARYKIQENDPYTHALKKLGYGVGDRITTETHPIITK